MCKPAIDAPAIRAPETRYPCPVCLGVTLEKTRVGERGELQLDHCPRCGGVWFDAGEVQLLRGIRPETLWASIAPRGEVHRAQCHACHTPMSRADAACPTCGHSGLLDCPICNQPMRTASLGELRLDSCERCKGVWFDHHELESVWRMELNAALERRRARGLDLEDAGSLLLLDTLMWHPGMIYYGAHAAGSLVGASVEALANAPAAAGGVVEAAGEAAAGVFETILEIISSFFE